MVERRPILDFFTHLTLILGVIVIALPLYITFVASTQTSAEVARAPMSLWPTREAERTWTPVSVLRNSTSSTKPSSAEENSAAM